MRLTLSWAALVPGGSGSMADPLFMVQPGLLGANGTWSGTITQMPLPGLEGWRSIHPKTLEALFPSLHGQIREHQRATPASLRQDMCLCASQISTVVMYSSRWFTCLLLSYYCNFWNTFCWLIMLHSIWAFCDYCDYPMIYTHLYSHSLNCEKQVFIQFINLTAV